MNQPLISIIIPVYKVEAWLDACLESVVKQTYKDLEILLVDDGSPDHCGTMCDSWAEKDSRIRVLHKENGGLSSARNAGLDVAKGEYILFVDSDDVLDPRICSHLYRCLTEKNAQIAICDAAHIFPGQPVSYNVSEDMRVMTAREATEEMWYQRSFLPSAWAKLYHRSVFDSIRFTEGLLYEDIDLMHLLFYKATSLVYTPSALYGYNHREDSITTKPFGLRDLDILKVANKILTFAQTEDAALLPSARCYACVAALRVELNAPGTPELASGRKLAAMLLADYSGDVLKDKNIRKKTRYGLLLYRNCRPLMRLVYKYINRWK